MAGAATTRISFGLRHKFDWSTGSDWPLDLTLPDLVLGYFGRPLRAAAPAITTQAAAAENTTASIVGSMAPPVSVGTTQVLYLQEGGDATVIAVTDINQGQIGDCFLLASIGELALWHSSAITNMIHVNADGTETVTLYVAASGQLPTYGTTSFKPSFVTIDNTFPSNAVNNGASQGVVGSQKEIWVQVLEKAVATLNGGYSAISNGGNPMIAMEEADRPIHHLRLAWLADAAAAAGLHGGRVADHNGYRRVGRAALWSGQLTRLHVREPDHRQRRADAATGQSVGLQ